MNQDELQAIADLKARRARLAAQLAEAEAALPAHSVRPWQMERVLELEESLSVVEEELARLEPAGD